MADTGRQAPPTVAHGLLRSSQRPRAPNGYGADAPSARWARTGIKTRNGSSQRPLRKPMPDHPRVVIQPICALPRSPGF